MSSFPSTHCIGLFGDAYSSRYLGVVVHSGLPSSMSGGAMAVA